MRLHFKQIITSYGDTCIKTWYDSKENTLYIKQMDRYGKIGWEIKN
jgi:hypothetical protein